MKDMTVEELIHELGNYETEDQSLENEINDLQAELLRRYEALEKYNTKLLNEDIRVNNELNAARKRARDLECCGNCYNDGDFCDFEKHSPQKYCPRWQFDGLTREERET